MSKINCEKFCPYNKEWYCPFYEKESDPIGDSENGFYKLPKITDLIKYKSRKTTASPGREKKESDPIGIFSIKAKFNEDLFVLESYRGEMTDLKIGKFDGTMSGDDSENKDEVNGYININSKESDCGGEIILYWDFDNDGEKSKINGTFETNWESMGDDGSKFYSGTIQLGNLIGKIEINADF